MVLTRKYFKPCARVNGQIWAAKANKLTYSNLARTRFPIVRI